MASRTKIVDDIARALRPDIFRWTKANYDRGMAGGTPWHQIDIEQQRIRGIVTEILMQTEKCGYRIWDPSEYVADDNVHVFETIMPLFPSLTIHKEFRKKFFKRPYKNRIIPE